MKPPIWKQTPLWIRKQRAVADLPFNPDDLDELEDTANELLRHEARIYVVHHQMTGMQAVEWIETYERAMAGDFEAVNHMLGFLYDFNERLREMMAVDDDEVDDYNQIHAEEIERVLGPLFDDDEDG